LNNSTVTKVEEGKVYNYWTVLRKSTKTDSSSSKYWECACRCGNLRIVGERHLKIGSSKSCGCKKKNKADDRKGNRFGKLLLLERRESKWLCQCDCGNTKEITIGSLLSGGTRSCGCSQHDNVTTHKLSRSTSYGPWRHMIKRCYNKNCPEYKYYGGRGIKVCGRWLGDEGIKNFIQDMGSGYR